MLQKNMPMRKPLWQDTVGGFSIYICVICICVICICVIKYRKYA